MADRVLKILDINYEKANLYKISDDAHDLTLVQQEMLRVLLHEYEGLLHGTLGTWNIDPVSMELKPDHKTSSARYYLVPKINKETFWKELTRLVDIGV